MIIFMASPNLTIRQVEAFQAFMQRRSVTRAAEMLYISQPAMSRLIADCEESVGFKLFERNQGRLVPTAEAQVLYDEVKRAFLGLDRIALVAEQIRTMRRGSLRIACFPSIGHNLLPEAVADFLHEHEGVDVLLQVESSRAVLELVAGQNFDACLVGQATPYPGVKLEQIYEGHMACIVPLHHQLAGKQMICPGDLADENFISFPESFDSRIAIDNVFFAHGVQRKTSIESTRSHSIIAMVEQDLGVSVIDPISAYYARDHVAVRKFEPVITSNIYTAAVADQPMSTLGMAFIGSLRSKLDALPRL
jgi:DNA-binding transcriptional LysR family regulator